MNWDEVNWESLDRLRGLYLNATPTPESYWLSEADLASYDFTYAQRIAWKWLAVLRDLDRQRWKPGPGPLLDWGCGSGVASRCVLSHFGAANFESVALHDRSGLAVEFATGRVKARFPRLSVVSGSGLLESEAPVGTLVLSHILNELPPETHTELAGIVRRAQTVIWVEPGTRDVSRALSNVRDRLVGEFRVVAPCTHRAACGMLAAGNEQHWCHFFADPPAEIFTDSGWSRFAQRAGIDLRSLPYSYLVLERIPVDPNPEPSPGLTRVIGRPRIHKGYMKIFGCDRAGVTEPMLQQRDAPETFRQFKAGRAASLQQWSVVKGKIEKIEEVPSQAPGVD
ncbi:MAG TPA: class I SAM-dependent methyltransferase [Candidatus Limnocylindria bacterium]|nr:class I SAM-dependent methyltransferase [Candidatus Limnocylindria bacterium]